MDVLKLFGRSEDTGHLTRLPSGSFTVDAEGRVIASTLPSSFPQPHIREIVAQVLGAFRAARKADLSFSEIVVNYSSMKITAREMRGGAIIFLAPETTK